MTQSIITKKATDNVSINGRKRLLKMTASTVNADNERINNITDYDNINYGKKATANDRINNGEQQNNS
jgi:hypothetical protein